MKRRSNLGKQPGGTESEALDTLNAEARRKTDTRRLIEASIEKKAKKRRESEAPASSAWKQTP